MGQKGAKKKELPRRRMPILLTIFTLGRAIIKNAISFAIAAGLLLNKVGIPDVKGQQRQLLC